MKQRVFRKRANIWRNDDLLSCRRTNCCCRRGQGRSDYLILLTTGKATSVIAASINPLSDLDNFFRIQKFTLSVRERALLKSNTLSSPVINVALSILCKVEQTFMNCEWWERWFDCYVKSRCWDSRSKRKTFRMKSFYSSTIENIQNKLRSSKNSLSLAQ